VPIDHIVIGTDWLPLEDEGAGGEERLEVGV